MEDLQIYIYTFLAAFVGVVPPGLVNMSVAKTCLEKGKRNGTFMAFGASLVVFFQALLAVLISKYIFSHPYVKSMFLKAGVAILILMFLYFLLSANRKKTQRTIKKRTGTKSFFYRDFSFRTQYLSNTLLRPYRNSVNQQFQNHIYDL